MYKSSLLPQSIKRFRNTLYVKNKSTFSNICYTTLKCLRGKKERMTTVEPSRFLYCFFFFFFFFFFYEIIIVWGIDHFLFILIPVQNSRIGTNCTVQSEWYDTDNSAQLGTIRSQPWKLLCYILSGDYCATYFLCFFF